MTGFASTPPSPLGADTAVNCKYSQGLDPIREQKTWSEAADQLLCKLRRSSTYSKRTSGTNSSDGSENMSTSESRMSFSPLANAAGRLLSKFKQYMRRRSKDESFHDRHTRCLSKYDTREFGFDTISGEIDRALMSTSSTSTLYLQGITLPQDCAEVAIFNQHGRPQLVTVDEFTTVARACRIVAREIDLCTMQLYEEVHQLPGFARPMEDHELIFRSATSWSANSPGSRFRLLENPNKYTSLTEANSLADRSLSLTSLQEEPNYDDGISLVLNNRNSIVEWCPDPTQRRVHSSVFIPTYVTSGVLWFRTPGQSWRKLFCFLHGSSMFYSLKRRCKSARYMRFLLDLSMVDIFCPMSTEIQLPFRAPTNELIICKPCFSYRFDVKTLTIFATKTTEGRIAWQNGIRIHKFGIRRLETNFQMAMPSGEDDQTAGETPNPTPIPVYTNIFGQINENFLPIDYEENENGDEQSTSF